MERLAWQGQTYYTTPYFHAQYRHQKAEEGQVGKYARHDNFRQKIRSIEAYDKLVNGGHIVILTWEMIKDEPPEISRRLQPLFKSTGYFDLILLDATAQLELTHHLDDELSKEIAYRHSKSTAAPSPQRKLTMQEMLTALAMVCEGSAQESLYITYAARTECQPPAAPHLPPCDSAIQRQAILLRVAVY